MSYYRDHQHIAHARQGYRPGSSPEVYGAVVGTVRKGSEHPITGAHGDHLQFYLDTGPQEHYQVDVNTQSMDGSEIGVYIAVEDLTPDPQNPPFGHPAYGVDTQASLSYQALGLKDDDFTPLAFSRIDSQLDAALDGSVFVCAYGMMFHDKISDVSGIHETHYTGRPDQDGALAIYSLDADTGKPVRTWFFFKFQENHIPS